MKRIFFLSVTLLLLTQANSYAQNKIGYVGPDEIFDLMPEVKKADTALSVVQVELSKTFQDQQNDLNEAFNKFVKDSISMTVSLKEIKRKDLQDRIAALGKKEQELNKALDAEKERLLAPIREKLLKAIKDVAKENGYGHVFYKAQSIVFPEADDLGTLVKKKLGIK
ncbi:MAG TPA: OmpH family outer membrane protein [Ferruginibacter sp.]|nr:OmpH family outer membrane protein [Ferruginibacter sp.]